MSRKFKIERDYYSDKDYLYQKKHVEFNPGVTVLIGCNGCGKTTLIKQLKRIITRELDLPCISYDNIVNGGTSSIDKAIFYGDIEFAASAFTASEGEAIALNMISVARNIGSMIKKHPESKEYWVFLDAIDSGFSVDSIVDLKEGLFKSIFETYPNKDIYIIVSANEYEMARGEACFDVVGCRYVNIKSYDRYRSLILKSREYKDNRYKTIKDTAKEE